MGKFISKTKLWAHKVCEISYRTRRCHYFYDRTTITLNICENLGKQENT